MSPSKILITISLLAMVCYSAAAPLTGELQSITTVGQTVSSESKEQTPSAGDVHAASRKSNLQSEKSHATEAKPEPDDKELGVGQTDVA